MSSDHTSERQRAFLALEAAAPVGAGVTLVRAGTFRGDPIGGPRLGEVWFVRMYDHSDFTVLIFRKPDDEWGGWYCDPECLAPLEFPDLTDLAAVESWLAR